MPELAVNGLTVRYGSLTAVRGLDLRVADGKILALVGANGAGKSSTVSAIMGFTAAEGSVRVDGRELLSMRTYRRSSAGVGLVPEGRQVFAPLTVKENLLLGGYRLSRTHRADALDEVCRLFPILRERAKQLAGMLSGGEQQMLAIGRALMGRPRILLIDEPSMGLSPIVAKDVFAKIAAVAAIGTAVLVAEQDANRARQIADDLCLLRLGEVVARGAAATFGNVDDLAARYFGGSLTHPEHPASA